MEWFRSQWQSLQRGVSQWTGLGSIWRNAHGAFQHHAAYIKIGVVVLAFVLALWLVWSVVFHFAQTFLMLRNISHILGWVFLFLVALSVGWLAWFIRRTLQGIQKESREARTKRLGLQEEEKVDPTVAYLASLPKPPAIGLLDVIQPGARALLETLIFARDPASYEKALKELERQEGRDGRAPEWMLARAQILLHLGRQPQAYRLFAEVQQRYAKTRYALDAALLDLAARLEFSHESVALPVEVAAPSAPLPSSSALAASASRSRVPVQRTAQEQDIFQQSTSVSRSPLLKPEELEQMLQSPSAEYPASLDHITHNDSETGTHTDDDLAALPHLTLVDEIEDALASLPSAFEHDHNDNYTLQTLVKRPVAPIAYAALIAAPTEDGHPTPPVPSFGILTPTPHNIEEEDLVRHIPLLGEEVFSEDELETLSRSFHANPDIHAMRDTPPRIATLKAEDRGSAALQTTHGKDNTQAVKGRRGDPRLERVEAEIDAWLREHPPVLGGILLEDARRCEEILEEVDQLREAGQRTKAHALLQDILRLYPTSRYAKDAKMRLLSDQLFVAWEDSSGSGAVLPKK